MNEIENSIICFKRPSKASLRLLRSALAKIESMKINKKRTAGDAGVLCTGPLDTVMEYIYKYLDGDFTENMKDKSKGYDFEYHVVPDFNGAKSMGLLTRLYSRSGGVSGSIFYGISISVNADRVYYVLSK